MSAHAGNLQSVGQDSEDVDNIGTLQLDKAKITPKEQALLAYVKVLTLEPANIRDTHTESLRKVGWTDEQIFEASFTTSMFAFFNRMADAYGLDYTQKWVPPSLRNPSTREKTAGSRQK